MKLIKLYAKGLVRTVRWVCKAFHNIPGFDKCSQKCCNACDMLVDYIDGVYRNFPWSTMFMLGLWLVVALFVPVDLIPDLPIPFLGHIDDTAALVALVSLTATKDINEYIAWKDCQDGMQSNEVLLAA